MTRNWGLVAALAILLGSVSIVFWGSQQLQGPTADAPPNAAEWLSAISTFWGAIAGGLGALGTAGALLVAAFTYKHQVEERNRMQAERRRKDWEGRSAEARRVSLSFDSRANPGELLCVVRNEGDVPVTSVILTYDYIEGNNSTWELRTVGTIEPKTESRPLRVPAPATANSFVSFRDTGDVAWKLFFDGHLEEGGPKETNPFAAKRSSLVSPGA